jgi:hypothetical protein
VPFNPLNAVMNNHQTQQQRIGTGPKPRTRTPNAANDSKIGNITPSASQSIGLRGNNSNGAFQNLNNASNTSNK